MRNTLYYGDNLPILRKYIADESVDLIYLDPPWNKKQTYNVLFQEKDGTASPAQIKAFEDTWHWDRAAVETYQEIIDRAPVKVVELMRVLQAFLGTNDMMAYLTMMCIRLLELKRVLKPSGSIYLHCDPTASHYLKLLMDAIFGYRNFRNELVWCYEGRELSKKQWNPKHDIILFYTTTNDWRFNWEEIKDPLKTSSREALSRFQDSDGRWFVLRYKVGGGFAPLEKERTTPETVYRQYVPEGVPPRDWFMMDWARKKERLSYPTQKPLNLLERIIKASSNEGDVVLDPFCGCGTTVVAAQSLHRNWIGIDITYLAISLIKRRLKDIFGEDIEFNEIGQPVDLPGARQLAHDDWKQFQWWAISLAGGRPTERDRGIDGCVYFLDERRKTKQIIIEVKGGAVSPGTVRSLKGAVEREKAAIGVLITMEAPTRGMRGEAASAGYYRSPGWNKDYPRVQILSVQELLEGKRIEYPPRTSKTFKEAQRQKKEIPQEELFE